MSECHYPSRFLNYVGTLLHRNPSKALRLLLRGTDVTSGVTLSRSRSGRRFLRPAVGTILLPKVLVCALLGILTTGDLEVRGDRDTGDNPRVARPGLCWPPCRRRRRSRQGTLRSAGPRSEACSRTRTGGGTPTRGGCPARHRIRGLPLRHSSKISSGRTTVGSLCVAHHRVYSQAIASFPLPRYRSQPHARVEQRPHAAWPRRAIPCTPRVRACNRRVASSDHLRHTFRAAVLLSVSYSLPSHARKRTCH